jgi:lysophospholipase L1-like esterase
VAIVLGRGGASTGVNSPRYDKLSSIYIPTDECLLRYRSAILRARHGGAKCRVNVRGDSTTLGVLSGTNPNTLLRKDYIWFSRARQMMMSGQMLPGQIEESIMQMAVADDARFSYVGATGGLLTNGQSQTFADASGHDAYDLVILRSGNAASVVVSGTEVVGTPLTVDLTTITNNQAATKRIPMSSTTAHTITIAGPAIGSAQITNIEPVTVANPPIMAIGGVGVSGQTLATLNPTVTGSGSNMAPVLRPLPDLEFLLMGVNDMRGSADLAAGAATYKANVSAFVTAFQAQGTDVVLMIAPSYNSNQSGVPSATESVLFHQAVYDVADAQGCAVIDMQRRWGYGVTPTTGSATTPATNNAMYDGTHMTLLGYWDKGRVVARFLADAAA